MPRYRKRPVVIDAVQFTGTNLAEITEFIGEEPPTRHHGLMIVTLEGELFASPGDWIIRGVQGEFYPCKPEIFDATYEPVYDGTPYGPTA